MKKLEPDVECFFTLDYTNVENFLSEVFGHRFELVHDEELSNYSSKEYDFKVEPLDKHDQKKLEEYKATGKGSFMFRILFQDCVNNGLADPGRYLVKIFW